MVPSEEMRLGIVETGAGEPWVEGWDGGLEGRDGGLVGEAAWGGREVEADG